MATKAPKTQAPSGYATHDSFFASRFKQGGRVVYALDLSPLQLINLVARPNPDLPVESNRQIRPKHAEGFASYFREHEEWVIPGLILRTPSKFSFDVQYEVAGTEFGLLEIPRAAARDINILDGQHRILGFFLAADSIAVDMEKARESLQKAQRADPDGAAVRYARERLATLNEQNDRLASERVAIQMFVEESPEAYRQMFFDISDNALGITASVRARFDSRKVVNRSLPKVLEHPLLVGRVEMEIDKLNRNSQELITARHVVEIIKSVTVGFNGRASRRYELEMVGKEDRVADRAKAFLDMLVRAFPPLAAVQLGQLLPQDLRRTSLLGSATFLRILAGLYHELLLPDVHAWKPEQIEGFFKKLAPHVSSDGSPVYPGSIWLERMPEGVFFPGATSPNGRKQDLATAYETMLDWALDRAEFLDEPPAPRPAPVPELTEEEYLVALEERAARDERS